jgi:hypothetical protein
MAKSTLSGQKLHSQHALLCLIGQKVQQLNLLEPLHRLVKIDQKTLVHSPSEKLTDTMLAIACGAEALSQINTVLRADNAVSRAWSRNTCADHSSVQETLSACGEERLRLAELGIKVWVRDLFAMPGRIKFKARQIVKMHLMRGISTPAASLKPWLAFAKSEIRLFLDEV